MTNTIALDTSYLNFEGIKYIKNNHLSSILSAKSDFDKITLIKSILDNMHNVDTREMSIVDWSFVFDDNGKLVQIKNDQDFKENPRHMVFKRTSSVSCLKNFLELLKINIQDVELDFKFKSDLEKKISLAEYEQNKPQREIYYCKIKDKAHLKEVKLLINGWNDKYPRDVYPSLFLKKEGVQEDGCYLELTLESNGDKFYCSNALWINCHPDLYLNVFEEELGRLWKPNQFDNNSKKTFAKLSDFNGKKPILNAANNANSEGQGGPTTNILELSKNENDSTNVIQSALGEIMKILNRVPAEVRDGLVNGLLYCGKNAGNSSDGNEGRGGSLGK